MMNDVPQSDEPSQPEKSGITPSFEPIRHRSAGEPSVSCEPKPQPKALLVATELGFALVISTCICGFIGYWIGQQFHNQALAFFLMVGGIIVGFGLGIYRMVKVSERMSSTPKKLKP